MIKMVGYSGLTCDVCWLGEVDYDTAWHLQERLASEIATRTRPPTLLLLEHPHVFTLGRRGKDENVLWNEAQRAQHGVQLRRVDRGGDVTYHGPGQLVGYPLLPLAPPGWSSERLPQADFVGYVRRLEEMLIHTLARLGVDALRQEGLTGVWVMGKGGNDASGNLSSGKIASIGVKVDLQGVSRHGFALNVTTDPLYWSGIVPCGIDRVTMVNLADLLDPPPSMDAVRDTLLDSFQETFALKIHLVEAVEDLRQKRL